MFSALPLWQFFLAVLAVSAHSATPTTKRSNNSPFVTTHNGHFYVNGKIFNFLGTNVYWLPALNSEKDIDKTLESIAKAKFTVVRTWAFNDVEEIPVNGTWFQLISKNGTVVVNDGPNGLQKLDTVVRLAKKHNLYLLLSLTNNWNPSTTDPLAPAKNPSRNVLSNDYGGMDVYVRNLGDVPNHDQFYVNETLINAFKNYTTQVVSRYIQEPHVLGWELANDPRCNSTLPATSICNPHKITRWHADVAQHVKSIDPNHLVSSGSHGFLCVGCPKLFPKPVIPPPPPPPQPSPKPGFRRRTLAKPLTRARLLLERKAALKKERAKRKPVEEGNGIRIRGRWLASRQSGPIDVLNSAFDGSHGVDSEDIINIPQIGFGSFQLFPDQNQYKDIDSSLPAFNKTLNEGLDWINQQAELGQLYDKPVFLTAFGLVTQNNSQSFVPFNSSVPETGGNPIGVSDDQRDYAYFRWTKAAVSGGLRGIVQYQWSQDGLEAHPGTPISPLQNVTGTTPIQNTTGVSPNDGYGIQGQGFPGVIGSIQQGAAGFVDGIGS